MKKKLGNFQDEQKPSIWLGIIFVFGCSGSMLLLLPWTTFVGTDCFCCFCLNFCFDSKLGFMCCLDYFCVKILILKSGCRHHLLDIQIVYFKNLITKFTDVIHVHDKILN